MKIVDGCFVPIGSQSFCGHHDGIQVILCSRCSEIQWLRKQRIDAEARELFKIYCPCMATYDNTYEGVTLAIKNFCIQLAERGINV